MLRLEMFLPDGRLLDIFLLDNNVEIFQKELIGPIVPNDTPIHFVITKESGEVSGQTLILPLGQYIEVQIPQTPA